MQVGYSAEDEDFHLTLREWFETHYPRFKAQWPGTPDPNELTWRRAWEDYVCRTSRPGLAAGVRRQGLAADTPGHLP